MEGGFSVLEGPMIGFSRERLLELVAMKHWVYKLIVSDRLELSLQ